MAQADPPDVEGMFNAALARHRAGALAEAADGYRRVIAASPGHAGAHLNLGVVLRRFRRFDEALASIDRGIALSPDKAGGHTNRGSVLRDLRRLDEALESYERALALAPNESLCHLNRASVLRDLKRPAEALESYDRAIALTPGDAVLHNGRGGALHELKRFDAAAAAFQEAIRLQPTLADAHRNRAVSLRRLGRFQEALASIDRAIGLKPGDPTLHISRGNLSEELTRPGEALESYDRAIALQPDLAAAHNGRGAALIGLDRLEEGVASLDRALDLDPKLELAHRNRGVALRKLRRPEEAVAAYDRAIALRPDMPTAYWYRSLCHLLTGRYGEGWRDYERRWDVEEFVRTASGESTPQIRARLAPVAGPGDVSGRTVLLVGEQGVGDVIMFASAIPDLLAVAGEVSLVCDPRLHRLLSHSFPRVRLLDALSAERWLEDFDAVIGIGSLGRLFRNRLQDFPATPYLTPRPEIVQRWAARLGPSEGRRRVGLSWRGGLQRTGRSERSMDLAELGPILDLPQTEFVSLQYGEPDAEVAAANAGLPRPIRIFPAAEIDDFEDLAGLVQALDLVISVQTSLVHLTGALGAPGLVMLPATPEWRYTAAAATMPWYGSIELFRRGGDSDWSPTVRRVAAEAARRLGLAGAGGAPDER
ncbi:tetratricopeptide repeat protein [uncultured Phenylobacterium sp.]|uniref:tetratricopeptide repeat protein n=1 Tax=uncultured Phenylobacterium sp. TaxID=349273 RepID=UPI0025CE91A0|nr:tetratricopeptide repeat protein [uncultured Phenylobacterium sp.]